MPRQKDNTCECICCGALRPGRRTFLKASLALGAAVIAPAAGHAANPPPRTLKLHNLHTGERVRATYWANGHYRQDGLDEINHVLRDHRADEITTMDVRLLDTLHALQRELDATGREVHVISGYRAPATNEMLRRQGRNVARRSLHTQGKAMDVRLAGLPLANVHQAALGMEAGGVGYYPASEFVHIDVGRVRRWGG